MKKRFVVLVSIIVLSLIVSVSAFLISKTANTSPPVNEQIKCGVLQENAGGINLVFFATEEQTKKYADYLLSVQPFVNHKEKFSFYFITPDQYTPKCDLYQGIALLCQSSELTKAVAACPNDYAIVLENQPNSIRSSAFKGVMSLNSNHPLSVFAHEFAHVFDDFAEEYSSPGASIPRGAENCQKDCSDFRTFPNNNEPYGCHQECTTGDRYREFQNGFMRTLSADRYGQFDELVLNEEVTKQFRGSNSITGRQIQESTSCQTQQFYLIESEGQEVSREVVTGCAPGGRTFGDKTYQIVDQNGEILTQKQTHSDILFTTDFNPQGEITSPPQIIQTPTVITVPVTGREQTLEVFDESGQSQFQTQLNDVGARPCRI